MSNNFLLLLLFACLKDTENYFVSENGEIIFLKKTEANKCLLAKIIF